MKALFRCLLLCCLLFGSGRTALGDSWALTGSLGVHDPAIIKEGNTWWVFSTGTGIPIKYSSDGLHWVQGVQRFSAELSWWRTAVPTMGLLDVWAPDVHWFNGRFWCYYCVSEFGTNQSAIGLTSCSSIALGDWRDDGLVIASAPGVQTYNTIDPGFVIDADGNPWLAFGSFFDGIHVTRLDPATLKPTGQLFALAERAAGIEAANIVYRNGFYYLFVSIDKCCLGVNSTYKIAYGRSSSITGPYLDQSGAAMSAGGSTVLDASGPRWIGPGGETVLQNGASWIIAFHAYDALNNGNPTLQISDLQWDANDWPTFVAPAVTPAFVTQPISVAVAPGSTTALSVSASGGVAYQWSKAGVPVAGATGATLLISGTASSDAATYTCVASNAAGSAVSLPATVSLGDPANPGWLVNLSCRAVAGGSDGPLIIGFVAGGTGTSGNLPLLIRASGPALVPFGIVGVLPDPSLELIPAGASVALSANTGWAGASAIANAATILGAFTWPDPSSLDSALLQSLPSGGYSAVINGASGDNGTALGEIYDASTTPRPGNSPRLINLSARSLAGANSAALAIGFVVSGGSARTVLIRASGPALIPFGVPALLPDPTVQLWATGGQSGNVLLGQQIGWDGNPAVITTANAAGAFAWGPAGANDSALLVSLPPGQYSAQVSGAARDTGVALIEVYEIP